VALAKFGKFSGFLECLEGLGPSRNYFLKPRVGEKAQLKRESVNPWMWHRRAGWLGRQERMRPVGKAGLAWAELGRSSRTPGKIQMKI
jgi:hypothetical protein